MRKIKNGDGSLRQKALQVNELRPYSLHFFCDQRAGEKKEAAAKSVMSGGVSLLAVKF